MVTWLRQNGRGRLKERGQTREGLKKDWKQGILPRFLESERLTSNGCLRTATVQAAATKRADRYLTDRGSLTESQRQTVLIFADRNSLNTP